MLNLATIGTSWITEQFIEACEISKKYNLHAIYSRTKEKADQWAEKHGAKYGTDDLGQLFSDGAIDIVYIASPNSLHFEHVMGALDESKHVIVEKPAFSTPQEATKAYQLAEEKSVYLFEAARHIHTKNYIYLRKIFEEKKQNASYPLLGANLHIGQYSSKYDAYQQALKEDAPVPNVFNPDFEAGSLMDIGVYPLYVALDLYGEPHKVSYHPVKGPNGIDLAGHVILDYTDHQVTIFASKAVHSRLQSEFYFDDETIQVNNITDLDRVSVYALGQGPMVTVQYPTKNPLLDEAVRFATIIEEKDQSAYHHFKELSLLVARVLDELKPY